MKLHGKGVLVKDFLKYWEMDRKTYERWVHNPKRHKKLEKMIDAMGSKNND